MVFKPCGFHLKYPDNVYMNLNKLAYVKQAYGMFAIQIVIVCNDLKDEIFLDMYVTFMPGLGALSEHFTTVP